MWRTQSPALPRARHHCRSRGNAQFVTVVMISTHRARANLLGLQFLRTRSSRISAAVPGMLPRPSSFIICRLVAEEHPRFRHAVIDLHRREGMHVHLWNRMLDWRERMIAVEKSVEVARQPALNTDCPWRHVPSASHAREPTSSKESEYASAAPGPRQSRRNCIHETDVREVDVAIYDISDCVSYGLLA